MLLLLFCAKISDRLYLSSFPPLSSNDLSPSTLVAASVPNPIPPMGRVSNTDGDRFAASSPGRRPSPPRTAWAGGATSSS
eukprot:749291-Hanusia_phi.AAC.2